jgi:8-oxo-dGTP pyrophosphatase MutT (NUDIX family)
VHGDGFITLSDGSLRWGRYGAAGVLVRSGESVFVAQRSPHCHQGGTWAIPGGALHSDESALEGALREFAEEIGLPLESFDVATIHEDDHGGWSYWTVVVDVPERFEAPDRLHWETSATAWVSWAELDGLELHPAFRSTLERLGLLASS